MNEKLAERGAKQLVTLVTSAGLSSSGQVFIQHWSPKQQLWRAAKTLLLLWGIAALTVLIPIAHFVLVPLFLVAGPVAASIVYKQHATVLGGSGVCPKCNREFEIVAAKDRWPLKDLCSACYQQVTILKQDSSSA